MKEMKNQPFKKRLQFAVNGILVTLKTEPSFRWQLLCGFGAYGILFFFKASSTWWAIFSIVIAMILSGELFNSALERTIDRLHPEKHSLIAEAKDCAAGAVLILSIASLVLLICFLFAEVWKS
jgi:diacylglycerol kinase (ATP)